MGPRDPLYKLRRQSQRDQLWRAGHVSRDPTLEEQEAEQRERERIIDYRLALQAEKQAVLAKLRHARTLPPDKRVRVSPFLDWENCPTRAAHVRELEQSIRDIDAELERIGES